MGIGTGLAALMLGASVFGMPMFYSYFSSLLVVLLNILPPILLTLFMYWVSGRAWIGFLVPALIVFMLAIVSYLKMQVRNEPLVISDFQLIEEAGDSIAGYDFVLNWKIWAAALYAVGGAVAAFFLFRHKPRPMPRLIGAVSVVLACAVLYGQLYTNDKVYGKIKGSYNVNMWSSAEKYISRGFVYPFIHSALDPSTRVPHGYDGSDTAAALSAYGDDMIPADQKVNIVSVMLEAYADFSVFDTIDYNVDVYGPLHALREESISGSLIVNTFAGGTINSERSFLTGYTKPGDFMIPVNSYVRYFAAQGYYTEGFHAGDNWYYNRKTVNNNLGFDNYYYLEDYENSNRWDDFFFSTIISLYEARDPAVPYFSYNLSYQNHGPYDSTTTCDTAYINKSGLTEGSYNILNNYMEGISDTTCHIAELINYVRSRSEPVIVILFGDHMPWLGGNNEVYRELGIGVNQKDAQDFYDLYTTPWLIWANDPAKEALGSDFTGTGGDFSPCFLMNRLFEACSWGGNAYMKAANELGQYVSVVNTATGFFEENGAITQTLSEDAKTTYENFERIEYYWKHNYVD